MAKKALQVEIWPFRSADSDPRTHFWYKDEKAFKRLCDNLPWERKPVNDNGLGFPVPCQACQDLYVEDVVYGRGLLLIRSEIPFVASIRSTQQQRIAEKSIDSAYNGVYTRYNECTPHYTESECSLEALVMPKVTMTFFAKFCTSSIKTQQRMVADSRQQEGDTRLIRARDYYGPIRNVIQRTHIANHDLDQFRDSMLPLLEKPKMRESQRTRFLMLGSAYVAYWKNWDAVPFEAKRCEIQIAELTIIVNPELRIRTSYGDDHVVKLWFNASPPSRQMREVLSHLMNVARVQEDWPHSWQTGILDIERKLMLPSLSTNDTFGVGLAGQAAAYLEMRGHN